MKIDRNHTFAVVPAFAGMTRRLLPFTPNIPC